MAYSAAEKRDYHEELTQRVIDSMENEIKGEWHKPWINVTDMPFNPQSKAQYRGVNSVALLLAGYDDPRFMTFKQIQEYNAENGTQLVLKDAKGKGIAIFKAIDFEFKNSKHEEDSNEPETIKYKRMVYAGTVFNCSLIEGMPPYQKRELKTEITPEISEEIQKYIEAMKSETNLKVELRPSNRAYYSPSEHKVVMPEKTQFKTELGFYNTLFHEFGHSTGGALGRNMSGGKNSTAYAFEELCAELTSYFVCSELGFQYDSKNHEQHTEYIKSWLSILKDDKNFIFKASAQATRAFEFIQDKYFEYVSKMVAEQDKKEQIENKPKQKSIEYSM